MKSQLRPGFGERLKEERKRIGLTQVQLAEKAGIKRVTQYLYEKEESHPNYRYLEALSRVGIDLQYLLFGVKESQKSLQLTPEAAREIYKAVDIVGRDDNGDLLPVERRVDIFSALCMAYSGRAGDNLDLSSLVSFAKMTA